MTKLQNHQFFFFIIIISSSSFHGFIMSQKWPSCSCLVSSKDRIFEFLFGNFKRCVYKCNNFLAFKRHCHYKKHAEVLGKNTTREWSRHFSLLFAPNESKLEKCWSRFSFCGSFGPITVICTWPCSALKSFECSVSRNAFRRVTP